MLIDLIGYQETLIAEACLTVLLFLSRREVSGCREGFALHLWLNLWFGRKVPVVLGEGGFAEVSSMMRPKLDLAHDHP